MPYLTNMKVLHIIDSGGLYGAEMVLLNLVAEQIKQGLDPTIASIGERGIKEKPIEAEALKRGFQVRKFRMAPGPNIAGAFEILGYAHKERFDLMHSHGYKGNILFGFMPKRVRKVPLVSTLHGWTSTIGLSKIRLYEWLDAKSLRFIDAVVLVNKGMLDNPRLKKVRGVKFHIVNNGIPLDQSTDLTIQRFDALDKTIIEFCQRGYTIGSIGRLSKEKGYDFLIEALARLVKDCVDARLVIIGEGPERVCLEKLAEELGIADCVLLPGYREDAKRYLPLFSIFVLPSLTEGLPMTLLEAMHAGVPIVATRVGGVPDALDDGEAGALVKARDSGALAKAIGSLAKDPSLASRLVEKAYDRVEECYSSERMAKEYLELYIGASSRKYEKISDRINRINKMCMVFKEKTLRISESAASSRTQWTQEPNGLKKLKELK